ncbi:hypothetical protein OBBRIDRAFT_483979 [Obba rivulosa]|uniref:DUF4246 domain-containing protein n=1 Tax=Obba rivulosa TaxID=1052685 RepID=A0A8E2DKX4_9APHY|nr:hypothetical protein OBBRIDRAFT_483979 [Obba rivulosa]
MRNERIVATDIYYYASSNISESCLAFRTPVGDGDDDNVVCHFSMGYRQDDVRGWKIVYGLDGARGPLNQPLGIVSRRSSSRTQSSPADTQDSLLLPRRPDGARHVDDGGAATTAALVRGGDVVGPAPAAYRCGIV